LVGGERLGTALDRYKWTWDPVEAGFDWWVDSCRGRLHETMDVSMRNCGTRGEVARRSDLAFFAIVLGLVVILLAAATVVVERPGQPGHGRTIQRDTLAR
jgi:hypothetical protein